MVLCIICLIHVLRCSFDQFLRTTTYNYKSITTGIRPTTDQLSLTAAGNTFSLSRKCDDFVKVFVNILYSRSCTCTVLDFDSCFHASSDKKTPPKARKSKNNDIGSIFHDKSIFYMTLPGVAQQQQTTVPTTQQPTAHRRARDNRFSPKRLTVTEKQKQNETSSKCKSFLMWQTGAVPFPQSRRQQKQ